MVNKNGPIWLRRGACSYTPPRPARGPPLRATTCLTTPWPCNRPSEKSLYQTSPSPKWCWGSKAQCDASSSSTLLSPALCLSVPRRGTYSTTETQSMLQATSYFEPTSLAHSTRALSLGLSTHKRKRSKIGHASVARASGESLTSSGSQSKPCELCKGGCALHACENWRARHLKKHCMEPESLLQFSAQSRL